VPDSRSRHDDADEHGSAHEPLETQHNSPREDDDHTTRAMIDDGTGRLRRATAQEADDLMNPLVAAWEQANEEQRSSFVRLFKSEIERVMKEGSNAQEMETTSL
jgi:hypothetical protein